MFRSKNVHLIVVKWVTVILMDSGAATVSFVGSNRAAAEASAAPAGNIWYNDLVFDFMLNQKN